MYPAGAVIFFWLILFWLVIISYLTFSQRQGFKKLLPKVSGESKSNKSLLDKLDEILQELDDIRKREKTINQNIKDLGIEGLGHIQKVRLKRFNPYGDVGGEVSFCLCLLSSKDSGVIITSLHTRSGTRIYAKGIKMGKSDLNLSKEEDMVLQEAIEE